MNALRKCLVTGLILKADGTACYPATVTFKISHRERDSGITIMPDPVVVQIGSDGSISVPLWPNVDGMAGTVYSVLVRGGSEGSIRNDFKPFRIVVPDASSANLADISELVAPTSIDDARAAVLLAEAAADAAEGFASLTAADRAATHSDRLAADADAAATAADRSATHADRIAADADAAATAADRMQTAADRVQTGADRVQTGQDRTAVHTDRLAADDAVALTAADRVQTGQDRTATHTDRLAADADAAATAADRVQTGQDRTATVAARAAADADATATAADRVQTGQDRTATHTDRLAADADAAATAADRAATHTDKLAADADAIATAADRVQTGIDRAAAANNAAQIGTSVQTAVDAKDLAIAQQLLVAGLKAGVDTTYAAMLVAVAAVAGLNGLTGAVLGSALRIVTATDVVAAFVYDTAKDSDGGLWRWRARGSWFYEALGTATRGTRQFFPKRSLIVARAASVTIYDLDDPTCPMWMVFNRGSTNVFITAISTSLYTPFSLTAQNGLLSILCGVSGSHSFLSLTDFIGDKIDVIGSTAVGRGNLTNQILLRNASNGTFPIGGVSGPLSTNPNSLAATVLPGTPVDPVRRLPAPTFAVMTSVGVNQITYDGTVTVVGTVNSQGVGVFNSNGKLWVNGVAGSTFQDWIYSPQNGMNFGSTPSFFRDANTAFVTAPRAWCGSKEIAGGHITRGGIAKALLAEASFNTRSCLAYINTLYNSGYIPGGGVLALAESTMDVTSLVGPGELITNSDFTTDLAGWTIAGSVVWQAPGYAYLDFDAGGGVTAVLDQSFPTVVGQTYYFEIDIPATNGTSNVYYRLGTTQGAQTYGAFTNPSASLHRSTFVATTTTTWFRAVVQATTRNLTINRVSVKRAVANRATTGIVQTDGNYAPVVVGTVSRAAVATGAELAAYGGFSAANYLEVPYTSSLDMGALDFSAEAWFNPANLTGIQQIINRYSAGNVGFALYMNGGLPTATIGDGTNVVNCASATALVAGVWTHLRAIRRGTVLELWVNGVRINTASVAAVGSISGTNQVARIGLHATLGTQPASGSIALPRTSTTPPVPSMIRAIYAAELQMFQPGAKCLLNGSDTVQGLSYDDGSDQLYIAKASNGTDYFKGLVRQGTISTASENALGTELVVNGQFTADVASWTLGAQSQAGSSFAWVSGAMQFTKPAGSTSSAYQAINVVAGVTYQINCSIKNETDNIALMRIRSNTSISTGTVLASSNSVALGTSGIATLVYTAATTGTVYLHLVAGGVGVTTFDSVTMRDISILRLSSDNHKGVMAANDNVAIFTDADVYMKTPSIGLRESMDTAIFGPAGAYYDRTYILRSSVAVTTNATPTVIGFLPMDKGEAGTWAIRVTAREYGEPAAPELASYDIRVTVHRPQEGNVAVSGSATYTVGSEVTGTMDVTVAANTTVQALAITGTGVASKNIEWGYEATFVPAVQQVAA